MAINVMYQTLQIHAQEATATSLAMLIIMPITTHVKRKAQQTAVRMAINVMSQMP